MEVIIFLALVGAGYLFLRRSKAAQPGSIGCIRGPGTFDVEVVGESHYQKALESICGGKKEESAEHEVNAFLVLEDTNQYDKLAVKVVIAGQPVGYLSKQMARQFRSRLKEGGVTAHQYQVAAVIRGGWNRGKGDTGSFGVWLDLPTEA